MTLSGIDGSNYIMSSIARLRYETGIIEGAKIIKTKDNYNVQFTGERAVWNGSNLVLSSADKPYEARVFKSVDDAISATKEIGLKDEVINIT